MNERQAGAQQAVVTARMAVTSLELDLRAARQHQRKAEAQLLDAIAADLQSWHGGFPK